MQAITSALINAILEFFKQHPAVLVVIMMACGAVIGYAHTTFAESTEVKQQMDSLETRVTQKIHDLDGKVAGFQRDVFTRFDEQRLYDMQREEYAIENSVAAGTATSRDHARLTKLRSTIKSLERKLNAEANAKASNFSNR